MRKKKIHLKIVLSTCIFFVACTEITIKEKNIRLNNKNIQIGYSSKMNSSTCLGVQEFKAKRI